MRTRTSCRKAPCEARATTVWDNQSDRSRSHDNDNEHTLAPTTQAKWHATTPAQDVYVCLLLLECCTWPLKVLLSKSCVANAAQRLSSSSLLERQHGYCVCWHTADCHPSHVSGDLIWLQLSCPDESTHHTNPKASHKQQTTPHTRKLCRVVLGEDFFPRRCSAHHSSAPKLCSGAQHSTRADAFHRDKTAAPPAEAPPPAPLGPLPRLPSPGLPSLPLRFCCWPRPLLPPLPAGAAAAAGQPSSSAAASADLCRGSTISSRFEGWGLTRGGISCCPAGPPSTLAGWWCPP